MQTVLLRSVLLAFMFIPCKGFAPSLHLSSESASSTMRMSSVANAAESTKGDLMFEKKDDCQDVIPFTKDSSRDCSIMKLSQILAEAVAEARYEEGLHGKNSVACMKAYEKIQKLLCYAHDHDLHLEQDQVPHHKVSEKENHFTEPFYTGKRIYYDFEDDFAH